MAVRPEMKLSYRVGGGNSSRSVALRRWITVPFILIIGLILWIGVLSDSSAQTATPGAGSVLYVGAVIAVAALLAYVDRNRRD
jgi:hypothetical protein